MVSLFPGWILNKCETNVWPMSGQLLTETRLEEKLRVRAKWALNQTPE